MGEQPGALADQVEAEALATERRRHRGPEQTGVQPGLDRLGRQSPERLGLLGPCRQAGSQIPAPGHEAVVVRSGIHRQTIGKLSDPPPGICRDGSQPGVHAR